MTLCRFVAASVVGAVVLAGGAADVLGANQGQAVSQAPAVPPVTVKLSIVIARFNGDKKVGSLPFVLMVIPGVDRDRDGATTSLQMGSEVPVPVTTFGDNKQQPVVSYSYRSLGTNISAAARSVDAGQFNVSLTVKDSQLLSDLVEIGGVRIPTFQSFTSSSRLLLRDGQTVQYIAATSKTSGEVIKLDVTLNVIK